MLKNINGSVLLIILFMLLTISAFVVSQRANMRIAHQTDLEKDTAVLQQAKQALLADAYVYSKAGKHGYRPGGFRCPDFNNDGIADGGRACNNAVLGRLPWKTLGIGELRDSSGENLWYAITPEFKNHKPPFNSHSRAQLQLDDLTNIIAVVIAPGAPINQRQATRQLNPLDFKQYLESISRTDFFSYTSIFTADNPGNDRLIAIAAAEVIPRLEKIAMSNLGKEINKFYIEHGHYPWMARHDLDSSSEDFNQAIFGLHSGRIPYSRAMPAGTGSTVQGVIIEQTWLIEMQWPQILLASVDETYTAAHVPVCRNKCLYQINDNDDLKPATLLLLAPGPILHGQKRPSLDLKNYYEAENTSITNGVFRYGKSSQTFNDQLYSLRPITGF